MTESSNFEGLRTDLICLQNCESFGWLDESFCRAGITTLLTTCTLGLTGRAGIPKVAYSTALDIFLLMCFFFVFAAIVEYAGVNYFTKGAQKDFTVDSDVEVQ